MECAPLTAREELYIAALTRDDERVQAVVQKQQEGRKNVDILRPEYCKQLNVNSGSDRAPSDLRIDEVIKKAFSLRLHPRTGVSCALSATGYPAKFRTPARQLAQEGQIEAVEYLMTKGACRRFIALGFAEGKRIDYLLQLADRGEVLFSQFHGLSRGFEIASKSITMRELAIGIGIGGNLAALKVLKQIWQRPEIGLFGTQNVEGLFHRGKVRSESLNDLKIVSARYALEYGHFAFVEKVWKKVGLGDNSYPHWFKTEDGVTIVPSTPFFARLSSRRKTLFTLASLTNDDFRNTLASKLDDLRDFYHRISALRQYTRRYKQELIKQDVTTLIAQRPRFVQAGITLHWFLSMLTLDSGEFKNQIYIKLSQVHTILDPHTIEGCDELVKDHNLWDSIRLFDFSMHFPKNQFLSLNFSYLASRAKEIQVLMKNEQLSFDEAIKLTGEGD